MKVTKTKETTMNYQVQGYSLNMGCDPEFFLKDIKGIIRGAEKLVPKDGIPGNNGYGKTIIDGVQVEINPVPSTCRESLAHNISSCFISLKQKLATQNILSLSFDRTIEVSKEELDSLRDENKKFGCDPSSNSYGSKGNSVDLKKIDPEEYKYRSAGGHMHLGGASGETTKVLKNPTKLVPLLDILVGNTSVLLDRDPGNIERRKLYGRAGEYRTPPHGLEYRVLSNFWLQACPIMSLVFGSARLCVSILATDNLYGATKLFDAFTGAVKQEDIIQAINENNFDLAMSNFLKIEPLIYDLVPKQSPHHFALCPETVPLLNHYIKRVNESPLGLKYWHKQDPLEHWTTSFSGTDFGIVNFLNGVVQPDLIKHESDLKKNLEYIQKSLETNQKLLEKGILKTVAA